MKKTMGWLAVLVLVLFTASTASAGPAIGAQSGAIQAPKTAVVKVTATPSIPVQLQPVQLPDKCKLEVTEPRGLENRVFRGCVTEVNSQGMGPEVACSVSFGKDHNRINVKHRHSFICDIALMSVVHQLPVVAEEGAGTPLVEEDCVGTIVEMRIQIPE